MNDPAPAGLLPAPMLLPSLTATVSRRSAIFGVSATAGALIVAPTTTAAASPDAWLIEIGQGLRQPTSA